MLEHWLWLAHRPGINEHTKLLLLQYFGSPEAVFAANPREYAEIPGLSPGGKQALLDKTLALFEEAVKVSSQKGVRILTIADEEYPWRLKNIYHPPLVLYCRGKLQNLNGIPMIGLVGTRHCSAYGLSVAGRLGGEISACGGLVVSGLAEGIDAAAMNGALQAGFPTVGVVGSGVDVIYPASNRALFERVEQNGCILSEFLPGTRAFKWNFPKRNRIISGLSLGVVIVEAPEKSGALHTARAALEQSRDVYAVPGNVDLPSFAGSNRLLREGACPVCCGWDVMSEYTSLFPDKIRKADCPVGNGAGSSVRLASRPPEKGKEAKPKQPNVKKDIDKGRPAAYIDLKTTLQGLSQEEQAIVSCLMEGEKLVDEVIAATGIPSSLFLRQLTMLELKGRITRLPGNRLTLRK